MDDRCNGLFDCLDQTDENECDKVIIDMHFYQQEIPPFKHGSTVKIDVSIFLLSVYKVELPTTFGVKIKLVLYWHDYRLTFTNLQRYGNIIEMEDRERMWTPPLRFSNTQRGILMNDEEARMSIVRQGEYTLSTIKEVHEARMFKGEENLVRYSREYKMEFECNYNLAFYPFDSQTCSINVDIPDFFNAYMDIIPKKTENLGTSKLDQFFIRKVELVSLNNQTEVKCMIHLKRIPWYHLTTTYLPTLCIVTIVLVTIFIDQSHFEVTIMVALTAMLVMYTLFQSISGSMPSTAYLKLLDYWLFFCLVLPFVVFIILVYWEFMLQREMSKVKPAMEPYDESTVPLNWCKWFLPLFTLTFVFVYFIVVLVVQIIQI